MRCDIKPMVLCSSHSNVPGFLRNGTKTDWHISPGSTPWLYILLKNLQSTPTLSCPSVFSIAQLMLSGTVALPTFDCLTACSISSSKIS